MATLKKPEGSDGLSPEQLLLKEKLMSKQKNRQLEKLEQRLQKVLLAEAENLRVEYGFEYDPEGAGKALQETLDRKQTQTKAKDGAGGPKVSSKTLKEGDGFHPSEEQDQLLIENQLFQQ